MVKDKKIKEKVRKEKGQLKQEFADFKPQSLFFNRELSWISFDQRVLEEAENANNPLFERLRFLSISAKNMDEFYMVRVAMIHNLIQDKNHKLSEDGKTPQEELDLIRAKTRDFNLAQQKCLAELLGELGKHNLEILTVSHKQKLLTAAQKSYLKEKFLNEIFPLLTPIAVDQAHPFPFISNLGFCLALTLHSKETQQDYKSVIPIPVSLNRFIDLSKGQKSQFIPIEQVILEFMYIIFPELKVTSYGLFRVLRNMEIEIDEEAQGEEDLTGSFQNALLRRMKGKVIRLTVDQQMPHELRSFLQNQLGVEEADVIVQSNLVGVACVEELIDSQNPTLLYPHYQPRFPERISTEDGDCFAAIRQKDLVVHHPYESFDVVVQFISQAAQDPKVVAIKQTLYRTSENSPIVAALIRAAQKGKSVTAMVELKARFDEEKNIHWAKSMEQAGVHVVYGFMEFKTHAKVSLVVRQEDNEFRSYLHLGTGNYHPLNAKIYTDLSFFTCDPVICRDALFLFNYMTGYASPKRLKKLIISPLTMREKLIEFIDYEIKLAKAGGKGQIWAKLNALADQTMIEKLYEASQVGVHIYLIVRGVCTLRPGVKGLSENIIVKSIVGRFLEHSRIICFSHGHGLPSFEAKVFISSADWMSRNLDRRIETLVPIENETVHRQILNQIMVANIKDEASSWFLQSDGTYLKHPQTQDGFSAHAYFMNNPSLSGRGKGKEKEELVLPPELSL